MIDEKGNLIITWCTDDILDYAKDNNYKCSKSQAKEILQIMDRQHDCNAGITWDTIDFHLSVINL